MGYYTSRNMDDHDICNLISLSIGAVMRQSLNDSFKEECKNALRAADTKSVEKILYEKLKRIAGKERNFDEDAGMNTDVNTDFSGSAESQTSSVERNEDKTSEHSDVSTHFPGSAESQTCTVGRNEDKTCEVLVKENSETANDQISTDPVTSNQSNLSDDDESDLIWE